MTKITYHTVLSLDGSKLIPFKVVCGSKFARLVRWLRRRAQMGGITVWSTVHFVDAESATPELIKHESRHVAQWHALGPIKFIWQYFNESRKHGYEGNAFEKDAADYSGVM